jgi:hypothetical protein
MAMLTIHRRWCCALGLLVAVVGCGGGSAPSGAAPPTPAAAPGPPPPPPAGPASGATLGAAGEIPAWAGQRTDEPFDVKAFLASRAAPADNASLLYQAALAPLGTELGGPSAASLQDEIAQLANLDKLAAGSVPPPQIDQVLAKASPALAQIDAAQAKPQCVFVTGIGIDALLPHAMPARNVSRLCVLQLQQSRNNGDSAAAEAAVRRSFKMSRDLQPRGPEVCQLVSIAMDGMTLSGMERITLTDPRLTAEQCDRLIAEIAKHRQAMLNRGDEGLKMSYILSRLALDDVQSGRRSFQEVVELLGGPEQSANDIPPMAGLFNVEAEISACNQLYALAIAAAAKRTYPAAELAGIRQSLAQRKTAIDNFKATVASTSVPDRPRLRDQAPSALCFIWLAPVEAYLDANTRVAAQFAGTQMLLSLRRYEIAHGSLPPDLQTAAAESVLKTVPLDPYDGQPLRFAMVAGKPTVYSVGKDLKDDGGQMDWKFGQQPGDYLFVLPPRTP